MVLNCDLRLDRSWDRSISQIKKKKYIDGKALKKMNPLRNTNASPNKFKVCSVSHVLKER